PRFAPAGQSTQMVVGATPARDRDILATAGELYRRHRLKRIYYSAYSPIPGSDARLPAARPPLVREHRLYQADWLLRFYGFSVVDVAADKEGQMLDLEINPKLAWALKNRDRFPVDVNTGPRELLLRIPGLGARAVDKIIAARRHTTLGLDDLARLSPGGLKRARPFLIARDHTPTRLTDRADLRRRLVPQPEQMSLFA
ncbi:MAG: biotin synthase, partial [Alphaproteobacteria bacterium]|nr:biotin synthase [Alphaproteobacteria bacterium]